MNIYAVRLITFSPTHTSKQVGEAIVRVRAFPMLPGQTLLSTRPANWKFLKTP